MGKTKEYPMVDRFFMQVRRLLFDTDAIRFEKAEALQLATELRALLAERDALKAKVPQPVRKLREYKGIVYDPGCEKWRDGPVHFNRAVDAVACRHPLTDADHAALLALRDDPWEKVEALEDVFDRVLLKYMDANDAQRAWRELRTWLAQQPAPEMTAAQHVEALVGMGAVRFRETWVVTEFATMRGHDVLILPPEATP